MFHTYYFCYYLREANHWVIDGGEPLFEISEHTAQDIRSGVIKQNEVIKMVEAWDESFKVGSIIGFSFVPTKERVKCNQMCSV
jgi:hypothetical protein